MQAVDLRPVPPAERTQPPFDLFLIFAGSNIAATTLVTGGSLVPAFSTRDALLLIGAGSLAGSALVAALSPVGPRLGVPSVVAARAALGRRGADLLALVLYVTNFAWIALNNVIAASACARIAGGPESERAWAAGLGLAAAAVVALGPRAVGLADRVAVPLLFLTGLVLTAACARLPVALWTAAGQGGTPVLRGLDLVIGYQVSWILMFADYSRYTASPTRGALAVFAGLAGTSLWFMPLGAVAARAAGTSDPAAMVFAAGLGAWGAALLALATVTTNFVNVYLSALAFRSLRPGWSDALTVWSIGVVGAALSLLSRAWLDRFADFMYHLGALLVPVGGVLLARFFLVRRAVDVRDLYGEGPAPLPAFDGAAALAWVLGAATYFADSPAGATLPALAVAVVVYVALDRLRRASA